MYSGLGSRVKLCGWSHWCLCLVILKPRSDRKSIAVVSSVHRSPPFGISSWYLHCSGVSIVTFRITQTGPEPAMPGIVGVAFPITTGTYDALNALALTSLQVYVFLKLTLFKSESSYQPGIKIVFRTGSFFLKCATVFCSWHLFGLVSLGVSPLPPPSLRHDTDPLYFILYHYQETIRFSLRVISAHTRAHPLAVFSDLHMQPTPTPPLACCRHGHLLSGSCVAHNSPEFCVLHPLSRWGPWCHRPRHHLVSLVGYQTCDKAQRDLARQWHCASCPHIRAFIGAAPWSLLIVLRRAFNMQVIIGLNGPLLNAFANGSSLLALINARQYLRRFSPRRLSRNQYMNLQVTRYS